MGIKTCFNGHKYDDSLAECPFCPKPARSSAAKIADVPIGAKTVNDSEAANRTIQTSGTSGVLKKTRLDAPAGKPSNNFGKTVVMSPTPPKTDEEASSRGRNTGGKLLGWLVSFSWDSRGKDYRVFEGRTRIGSDREADVFVDDALMSKDHAQMVCRNGVLEIKDSFSTNGTIVNGIDLRDRTELQDGDVIKMGNTLFKLRLIGDVPNE